MYDNQNVAEERRPDLQQFSAQFEREVAELREMKDRIASQVRQISNHGVPVPASDSSIKAPVPLTFYEAASNTLGQLVQIRGEFAEIISQLNKIVG